MSRNFCKVACIGIYKTLWQKEKLLVLSNFSFCHNVFKSLLLRMCQNASISGKGLNRCPQADIILIHLQQLTFENILANGEIDYYTSRKESIQCVKRPVAEASIVVCTREKGRELSYNANKTQQLCKNYIISLWNPFVYDEHLMVPLQETTFEKYVTKNEIALTIMQHMMTKT